MSVLQTFSLAVRPSRCGIVRFSSNVKSNAQYSPHQYCLNLVRSHDFENYLSTLLIKGRLERQGAFTIRAFNVEIAKVASAVSDEKLARIRLQFWHDALNQIYDKCRQKSLPEHPVIFELNHTIAKYKLPKPYLQRLIQARQRPSNLMFTTTEELEQYADHSTSSAYYLLLKIVGVEDLNADHAVSHLGKAQGICNMLRGLMAASKSNKDIRFGNSGLDAIPPIPQEILLRHGCSYERVLRQGLDDVAVQNCIFDVASVASIHLEKARNLNDKVPKHAKAIFLPAIAVDRFLKRLRFANFQLNDRNLMRRDEMLPLAYYWNNFRRKY